MLTPELKSLFKEKMLFIEKTYPKKSPVQHAILNLIDYVTTTMKFDPDAWKSVWAKDAAKGLTRRHIRYFFNSYPYPYDPGQKREAIEFRAEECKFLDKVRTLFIAEKWIDPKLMAKKPGWLSNQNLWKNYINPMLQVRMIKEVRVEGKGRLRLGDSFFNASLPFQYNKMLRKLKLDRMRPYAWNARRSQSMHTLLFYHSSIDNLKLKKKPVFDALEKDLVALCLDFDRKAQDIYRKHAGNQPKLPPAYFAYWKSMPTIIMTPIPVAFEEWSKERLASARKKKTKRRK